jgi:hypothetical protein
LLKDNTLTSTSVATNTITEKTTDNGVSVENVLLKDGNVDGVNVSALSTTVSSIQVDLDGFPDALKNLSTTEINQLENLGSTTISSSQWGYVGNLDQNLRTTDSVSHGTLTLTSTAGNNLLAIDEADTGGSNYAEVDLQRDGTSKWFVGMENIDEDFRITRSGHLGTDVITSHRTV